MVKISISRKQIYSYEFIENIIHRNSEGRYVSNISATLETSLFGSRSSMSEKSKPKKINKVI